ncbi:MAG: glucuronate isomerase [Planctomycetota bacterium]|nr:MAG: glucuronate isomerase [Planctomycetota bacterium]
MAADVRAAVRDQAVWDFHTHLYPPTFGTPLAGAGGGADPQGLMLWGVDALLTYHYLVAEVFRVVPPRRLAYEDFWRMTKREQADHIWKHLFIERSPLSEACRGVVTTLRRLGLEPDDRDLEGYRRWFAEQTPDGQIDRVMELARVSRITMTNAVFDDNERRRWLENPRVGADSRFAGVLRFDLLVQDWPAASRRLAEWGYQATAELTTASVEEARRFLREWIDRIGAIYCAVSLTPDFRFEAADDARPGSAVLAKVVLPVLAERGLPLAMMIGAKRQVNPGLGDGGDGVGLADVASVGRLCAGFPQNRFFCTMLARENQHELCIAARKFGNLMPFGCWWFLNNPSLIDEITRMRVELLGTSFIPQHSDARVLEQLIYKWDHSRELIAAVLAEKYGDLARAGWRASQDEVRRDVRLLLAGNLAEFLAD